MARHGSYPFSLVNFWEAARRFLMVSPWYSWVPWEKLSLAMFMPASIMSTRKSVALDTGPERSNNDININYERIG